MKRLILIMLVVLFIGCGSSIFDYASYGNGYRLWYTYDNMHYDSVLFDKYSVEYHEFSIGFFWTIKMEYDNTDGDATHAPGWNDRYIILNKLEKAHILPYVNWRVVTSSRGYFDERLSREHTEWIEENIVTLSNLCSMTNS